ncbi:MAG: A/G-specific adenine glycosylase [Thermoplasmata archaeon]|nr:A/G-specific adenine glycosylase [Thermoplasmata archaeon]
MRTPPRRSRSSRSHGRARAIAPPLVAWYRANRRPLPWRKDRDPYRIWVAEVLLQQTRVAQALPYYVRLLARYPNLRSLASSDPAELLKLWQGAGYYARASRMHAAARAIQQKHGGRFPSSVEELERLPGVGPYMARAIASLAFGAPVLALEANGLRVAARLTGDRADPAVAKVRERLAAWLDHELPPEAAGEYNEALMELGETICLPRSPLCGECPIAFACVAFRTLDDPGSLPQRAPRASKRHEVAAIVAVRRGARWLLQKRTEPGLLRGLWEFPGGKPQRGETLVHAARRELAEETGLRVDRLVPVGVVRHAYSHFSVELHLFRAQAPARHLASYPARWLTPEEIRKLPLPRATEKALSLLGVSPPE